METCPGFDVTLLVNDTFPMVYTRSSSWSTPAAFNDDFSATLTTTAHSPQQLAVV